METPYEAVVEQMVEEGPEDRSFWLRCPEGSAPRAYTPGQFLWVQDPTSPEPKARAYSYSNAPEEGPAFRITVRYPNAEEARRWAYPEGHVLNVSAPLGTFVTQVEDGQDLLLLGAGSGIAPLRSYLGRFEAMGAPGRVGLIQSDRTLERLLFRSEFDALAIAGEWFDWRPRLTGEPPEGWSGGIGRIDQGDLADWIQRPEQTHVHACGPKDFVSNLLEAAEACGVPKAHLKRESW